MTARFIVHLVTARELESYLNGVSLKRTHWEHVPAHGSYPDEDWRPATSLPLPDTFIARPAVARLVGIYQEDVSNGGGYINDKSTHEEYRVVWECGA